MSRGKKIAVWVGLGCALVVAGILVARYLKGRRISVTGAVVRKDTDSNKELPIADVEVTASNGETMATTKSDATGYFRLRVAAKIIRNRPFILQFRHADYQPLDMKGVAGDKLYVAQMAPVAHEPPRPDHPDVTVGNVVIRYSVKATTVVNVGTAVKAFQVVNKGNMPCDTREACSPDGKWKATLGGASLDAGDGNVFQNARASCISKVAVVTGLEARPGTSQQGNM